jgi:HAMP domain-containing protein
MAFVRVFAALLLLVGLSGCGAMMRGKEQAERAVAEFRRQVDQGRFQDIYNASGPELKQTATEGEFTRMLGMVRDRLGAVRSTEEQGWNVNVANGGTVVNLTYQTQFAAGPATEQFIYRIEGERAVLIGYHVNSNALIGPAQAPEAPAAEEAPPAPAEAEGGG